LLNFVAISFVAVPSKVQNLSLKAETDQRKPRTLFIQWRPPVNKNGNLSRYYVIASSKDSSVSIAFLETMRLLSSSQK
jgi:hypothetical protein